MVRAEVGAEEALHLMTSRRVFLTHSFRLFFPHSQLSVPDWTRWWPIIFPVPPATPTALLHHGWGTGGFKKVFDRLMATIQKHSEVDGSGGDVRVEKIIHNIYSRWTSGCGSGFWLRHDVKNNKKFSRVETSHRKSNNNNIKNNRFATWNSVIEIFGA